MIVTIHEAHFLDIFMSQRGVSPLKSSGDFPKDSGFHQGFILMSRTNFQALNYRDQSLISDNKEILIKMCKNKRILLESIPSWILPPARYTILTITKVKPVRCDVFASSTYLLYTSAGSWLIITYDFASGAPGKVKRRNQNYSQEESKKIHIYAPNNKIESDVYGKLDSLIQTDCNYVTNN